MIKITCKKGSDQILQAVVVGGPASDMIMTVVSGMHNGLGLAQIGDCVFTYPSWSESFKHLADEFKSLNPNPATA